MPYTGLAVAFVLVAVLVGSVSPAAHRPWVAAGLAAAMVAAQLAFLLSAS
jgi:hypothetical protein